jgi:hypothetical protein
VRTRQPSARADRDPSPQKGVHRAGGAFVHHPHKLSAWPCGFRVQPTPPTQEQLIVKGAVRRRTDRLAREDSLRPLEVTHRVGARPRPSPHCACARTGPPTTREPHFVSTRIDPRGRVASNFKNTCEDHRKRKRPERRAAPSIWPRSTFAERTVSKTLHGPPTTQRRPVRRRTATTTGSVTRLTLRIPQAT